jgi:hypothetical protein
MEKLPFSEFATQSKLATLMVTAGNLGQPELLKSIVVVKGILDEYLKIFPEYAGLAEMITNDLLKDFTNKELQSSLVLLKNNGITFNMLNKALTQRGGMPQPNNDSDWSESGEEGEEDGASPSNIRNVLGQLLSGNPPETIQPLRKKQQVERASPESMEKAKNVLRDLHTGRKTQSPNPNRAPEEVIDPKVMEQKKKEMEEKKNVLKALLQPRFSQQPVTKPVAQAQAPAAPAQIPKPPPQPVAPAPLAPAPLAPAPLAPAPLAPAAPAQIPKPPPQPVAPAPVAQAQDALSQITSGQSLVNEFRDRITAGPQQTSNDRDMMNVVTILATNTSRLAEKVLSLAEQNQSMSRETNEQSRLQFNVDIMDRTISVTTASVFSLGLFLYFLRASNAIRTITAYGGESISDLLDVFQGLFEFMGLKNTSFNQKIAKLIKSTAKDTKKEIYSVVASADPKKIIEEINLRFNTFIRDKIAKLNIVRENITGQIRQYEAQSNQTTIAVKDLEDLNKQIKELNSSLDNINKQIDVAEVFVPWKNKDSPLLDLTKYIAKYTLPMISSDYKKITNTRDEQIKLLNESREKIEKLYFNLNSDEGKQKAQEMIELFDELIETLRTAQSAVDESNINRITEDVIVSSDKYVRALTNYENIHSSKISLVTRYIPGTEAAKASAELQTAKSKFEEMSKQFDETFETLGKSLNTTVTRINEVERSGNITTLIGNLQRDPIITGETIRIASTLALAASTEATLGTIRSVVEQITYNNTVDQLNGQQNEPTWGQRFNAEVVSPSAELSSSSVMIPATAVCCIVFILIFLVMMLIMKISRLSQIPIPFGSLRWRGGKKTIKKHATKHRANNKIKTKKYKKHSVTRKNKRIKKGKNTRKH